MVDIALWRWNSRKQLERPTAAPFGLPGLAEGVSRSPSQGQDHHSMGSCVDKETPKTQQGSFPPIAGRRNVLTAPPAEKSFLKFVLAGDSGVGKTSLLVRYTEGIFTDGVTTLGVDQKAKTIELDGKVTSPRETTAVSNHRGRTEPQTADRRHWGAGEL